MSPILLAFSSGGALEAVFDYMSLFHLKSWDAEDRVILGCIYRLFGLSLLVLGNYSPRHEPWVLMESGPGHKFSGPTIVLFLKIKVFSLLMFLLYPTLFSKLFEKKTNKYFKKKSIQLGHLFSCLIKNNYLKKKKKKLINLFKGSFLNLYIFIRQTRQ